MPVDAQEVLETAEDGGLHHPYLLLSVLTDAGVSREEGHLVLRQNGYPVTLGTPDDTVDPRVDCLSSNRCNFGFAGNAGLAG
jgi:hypothetical protein